MGFTLEGSFPLSETASRIAAKSATAGTPVKSCIKTLDGRKKTSCFLSGFSRTFLIRFTLTSLPSSNLNKFSISIFFDLGRVFSFGNSFSNKDKL